MDALCDASPLAVRAQRALREGTRGVDDQRSLSLGSSSLSPNSKFKLEWMQVIRHQQLDRP
jgi:hypothetical protein